MIKDNRKEDKQTISPPGIWRRFSYYYYRNFLQKEILLSAPIMCDKDSDIEVHILTCRRDFLSALWALKTFYYYAGVRCRLFVHGDGSLDNRTPDILRRHFINAVFISKAKADEALKSHLNGCQWSSFFRLKDAYHPLSMKLFDFFYYSRTQRIIMLDSDTLFFKRPAECLKHISAQRGFFLNDSVDSYSLPLWCLNELFGIEILERVNTGFIFFAEGVHHDLSLIERCLSHMADAGFFKKSLIEQTVLAVILSHHKGAFMRLPDTYQVSETQPTEEAACGHPAGGGDRINFYIEGLRRLKNSKFLESLNNGRIHNII